MSTIKDSVLEDALAEVKKDGKKLERNSESKVRTFQKRARISIEAIFIIKFLCNNGWDFERIACRAHVLELTVRKWSDGEAVPHLNNLLMLRSIRDEHNKREAEKAKNAD